MLCPQTDIKADKMLQDARMAAMRKLHRIVGSRGESPEWAVASTGGRNTLIFRKRWSVGNEVSYQDLLFG
jgi:hypothetical protein